MKDRVVGRFRKRFGEMFLYDILAFVSCLAYGLWLLMRCGFYGRMYTWLLLR